MPDGAVTVTAVTVTDVTVTDLTVATVTNLKVTDLTVTVTARAWDPETDTQRRKPRPD